MNGFVHLPAGRREPQGILGRGIPSDASLQIREQAFANGEVLLSWGYLDGDVHCCQSGDDAFLVFSGFVSEISGGPEVASQGQNAQYLLQAVQRDSSPAALRELLARLHGSFAIYYRDLRRGFSLCLTDRMASRPLWKHRTGEGWIVSSHANVIAFAVPSVQMDPGALGAFLVYSGPVNPKKSLFAGVEAVSPGSIVKLSATAAAEESRWYRFHHDPDDSLSRSDWIDLISERLVRAAARICRKSARPVVFFSGGVDSRLTAAALKAAGAKPLLFTMGDARNLEVRLAAQAAKALELEHMVMVRDKHWYLRNLPRSVRETGGSFVWKHGHFSQAIVKLKAEYHADAFFLGDLCEAYSKLFCAVEPGRRLPWTTREFVAGFDRVHLPMYRPSNRNRTLSLLSPGIRADAEAALLRDVEAHYASLADTARDPWILGDQFFRWESAASLPTFFMFLDVRSMGAERNLMFDKEVHEVLERLPARWRNGANLGALLIRKLAPRAGRMLNSNSLLPVCWPPLAHKASMKCKPILGRLRRAVLGRSHLTTGAWPDRATLFAGDATWRKYIDKLLDSDALYRDGWLDRDRVHQCWDALLNGDRGTTNDIEELLQLGILSGLRDSGLNGAVSAGGGDDAPHHAIPAGMGEKGLTTP